MVCPKQLILSSGFIHSFHSFTQRVLSAVYVQHEGCLGHLTSRERWTHKFLQGKATSHKGYSKVPADAGSVVDRIARLLCRRVGKAGAQGWGMGRGPERSSAWHD